MNNLLIIVFILLLFLLFVQRQENFGFNAMTALKGYDPYRTIFPYELYGYSRFYPYGTNVGAGHIWADPLKAHYSYPSSSGEYHYHY